MSREMTPDTHSSFNILPDLVKFGSLVIEQEILISYIFD